MQGGQLFIKSLGWTYIKYDFFNKENTIYKRLNVQGKL